MANKVGKLLGELLAELAKDEDAIDVEYAGEVAIVQYIAKTTPVDGVAGPDTKRAIAAWLDERIAARAQQKKG